MAREWAVLDVLRNCSGTLSAPISGNLVTFTSPHNSNCSVPARISSSAILSSDRASGMTGSTVNLTMGSLDD